jgi:glycosyltransferase involved in cell wall biosynthesis
MEVELQKGNGDNTSKLSTLRVAIVHYWLLGYGGGERVVSALLDLFPQADLFALVANDETSARFAPHRVTTSFLQRLPGSRRYHRHMLPLCPLALEQFDLRDYDLAISSESGPAKGVLTLPTTLHISYCHSPMRYIWDLYHEYIRGKDMSGLTRLIFAGIAHYMRIWDFATASRVDFFVANSYNVAGRIRKHYRRNSRVIYPPVDVASGYVANSIGDYYLVVSRLVDYKRTDLAVLACAKLRRRLRVIGTGPQYRRLKELAGPTVEFLGELTDLQLREQYAHCRALLFPGEEDFGIVPVEAQSFGRPVIAYGRGGVLETVHAGFAGREPVDGSCGGIFFGEQTVDSVVDAILAFEAAEDLFSPQVIAHDATRFSTQRFKREMTDFVRSCIEEFPNVNVSGKLRSASARGGMALADIEEELFSDDHASRL